MYYIFVARITEDELAPLQSQLTELEERVVEQVHNCPPIFSS